MQCKTVSQQTRLGVRRGTHGLSEKESLTSGQCVILLEGDGAFLPTGSLVLFTSDSTRSLSVLVVVACPTTKEKHSVGASDTWITLL